MKGNILKHIITASALGLAAGATAAPGVAVHQPVAPSSITYLSAAPETPSVLPASVVFAPTIATPAQAASVFNPGTPLALRSLAAPGGTVFPGTVGAAVNGIDTGIFLPGRPLSVNTLGGLFNPATAFTTSVPGSVIITGGAQSGGATPSGVIVAGGPRGVAQTAGGSVGNVVIAGSPTGGVQAPGAPVIVTGGSTVVAPSSGTAAGSVIVTGGQP